MPDVYGAFYDFACMMKLKVIPQRMMLSFTYMCILEKCEHYIIISLCKSTYVGWQEGSKCHQNTK